MNRGREVQRCSCCGAPVLTRCEMAIVMCLYAFGGRLKKKKLAQVAQVAEKTIWRTLKEKPELFEAQIGTGGKTRTTIALSEAGKHLALRIRVGTDWMERVE